MFNGLYELMPMMCKPASTLRVCFSVNQVTCESRVNSAFETCLRDQKIKYAGRPVLDAQSAADAENNLKKCVLTNYSTASMTSYRKSADCEKWVPKIKKSVEQTAAKNKRPQRPEDTAFEDPLDGQRDMLGRYKLRVLHDMRMVEKLKGDIMARKTCINDKVSRESNITCFKRMLKGFEVTSSPQILAMAAVATAVALKDKSEGFSPSSGQVLDVILSVSERAQIENFHLWNLQANTDADRVVLNQLRIDDEALLKSAALKMHGILQGKMNEPSKGREPANISDIKMRIGVLKTRKWSYHRQL